MVAMSIDECSRSIVLPIMLVTRVVGCLACLTNRGDVFSSPVYYVEENYHSATESIAEPTTTPIDCFLYVYLDSNNRN